LLRGSGIAAGTRSACSRLASHRGPDNMRHRPPDRGVQGRLRPIRSQESTIMKVSPTVKTSTIVARSAPEMLCLGSRTRTRTWTENWRRPPSVRLSFFFAPFFFSARKPSRPPVALAMPVTTTERNVQGHYRTAPSARAEPCPGLRQAEEELFAGLRRGGAARSDFMRPARPPRPHRRRRLEHRYGRLALSGEHKEWLRPCRGVRPPRAQSIPLL